MKNKDMLKFLVLIGIFLLFIQVVNAYDLDCYNNGVLKVSGENTIGWNDMTATYLPTNKTFDVTGFQEIIQSASGQKTYKFYSDDLLFAEKGKYTVKFGGVGYNIECPGLEFSCSLINLSLEGCYSEGRDSYIYFYYEDLVVDGWKNIKDVDLLEDINYQIYATESYWDKGMSLKSRVNTLPENVEITNPIGNLRVMRLRFDEDNKLVKVRMAVKGCELYSNELRAYVYPNTLGFIECGKYAPCETNDDCEEGKVCDKEINFCTTLKCGNCEEIKDNRCVKIANCCKSNNDCSDNSKCTFDKCVDGSCVYEKNTCDDSTDSCVAGKCMEDTGECKYFSIPNCETNDITGAAIGSDNKDNNLMYIAILAIVIIAGFVIYALIVRKNK